MINHVTINVMDAPMMLINVFNVLILVGIVLIAVNAIQDILKME